MDNGHCEQQTVQPHWCGERIIALVQTTDGDGSAPLVWGTLLTVEVQHIYYRFSPTGVGNVVQG